MVAVPSAVSRHADRVAAAQFLALRTSSRAWKRVDRGNIAGSWLSSLPELTRAISAVQLRVAVSASEVGAFALAEQGTWIAPSAFVDPSAFAGVAPDGRTLEGLLNSPSIRARQLIGSGVSVDDAIIAANLQLGMIVRTLVADTARQAASVDIAARTGTGYTRVVVGETCKDCVILAGRFYRWNTGFKRHPKCDCLHVPTTQALSVDSITDPYEHFNSLTEAEQDAMWGQADAQAIRDGADIFQVYNSRRGMSADRMTTLSSTGRRGQMPGQVRLTPDGIYAQATSREEALRLLEQNRYILPGGQRAEGVIRGMYTTSAAERRALLGGYEYVGQTAAQKRLERASSRWDAVLEGRNPFSSTKPLTPDIAATVERDYRRWLRTGGQVFAN